MRLIDADKLKKHYSWWAFQDCDLRTQKEIFDDIVEVQPTVESRPQGKWLRKEYYFDEWVDECSVCGEAYTMIDGTATENGYNYCPNCGAYMVADMRGEE